MKQGNQIKNMLNKKMEHLALPLFAIFLGFVIGGLVIALSGYDPFATIGGILAGGFGSGYYLSATLTRATPIIFAGLAAELAWGSGYPSMGAAGQMALGALASAITAIYCPGPSIVVCIVSLLAGSAVGMAVSYFSSYICNRFEMWLLIVTLMLNYVCENICSYLTTYVFKDPMASDASAIQTQKITEGILPKLFKGYAVHGGFILALLAVAGIWFMMRRTSFGYKARMGGLNPHFADYGGISSRNMMFRIMMISGALAGIGGACEVLGSRYRYVDAMISSPGYAWTGVITTLMAGHSPLGVLFCSIFMAGISTGGSAIERSMGLSSDIVSIISGVITLLVTARFSLKLKRNKKQQKGGKTNDN